MNKTYIPTLVVIVLLAILHSMASKYHWYHRFYGFDIVMHILGGVGLALSIYWILATFFKHITPTFWLVVALTFVAGIAWEVMEYVYNIAGAPIGTTAYYIDTAKDLCDDTLGAIITCLFLNKK